MKQCDACMVSIIIIIVKSHPLINQWGGPFCHIVWFTTIIVGDGLTPLGLAVEEGKLNTIKYLISECNVAVNGKLVDVS